MDIPTSKIVDVSWKFGELVKYLKKKKVQAIVSRVKVELEVFLHHFRRVNKSLEILVTAASSESDKVGKTFLQLRLLLDEGGKTTSVFTEMTLSQFYKFLHDLEKAKNSLDLLV